MLTTKKYLFFYLLLFLINSLCFAQSENDTTKSYLITLNDGSEIFGKILSETETEIIFLSNANIEMKIKRESISEIKEFGYSDDKISFYREDRNDSRLFIGPTARSPKRGDISFSIYEIFFPFLTVGVTENFSLSGGFSLLPSVPIEKQIFYISPKLTVVEEKSLAISFGTSFFAFEANSFGFIYGVSTIGKKQIALTWGLAKGFSKKEFSEDVVMIVGFDLQVSNSVKIISENWVFINYGTFGSFGVRFFGKNLSGDFGLMTVFAKDSNASPLIPWIGFSYNF